MGGLGVTQGSQGVHVGFVPRPRSALYAWFVWLPAVKFDVYFSILGWERLRIISNPNSLFLGDYQVYTLSLSIAL